MINQGLGAAFFLGGVIVIVVILEFVDGLLSGLAHDRRSILKGPL